MDNNKEDTENIEPCKAGENQGRKPGTFKPGQSGNPNGRPKRGTAIADLIRKHSAEVIETEKGKQMTRGEAVVHAIYMKALKGGDAAQRLYLAYDSGMPIQRIEAKVDGKTKDIFNDLPEDEQKLIADIYDRRTEG